MAKEKWVYSFGAGGAEGRADMRNLLGGKGANLAEMASLGLPVPPGFTITTEVCTYFYANGSSYPPDLETLVNGVNVLPRGSMGGRGVQGVTVTDLGSAQLSTKQKVYLRGLPIDPMTGKADWELRSSYDPADSSSWGGENVWDVRSKSRETALNGEKYSDW